MVCCRVGRVTLCAPPPANERSLIRHDGAHGSDAPAILDLPMITGKWYDV